MHSQTACAQSHQLQGSLCSLPNSGLCCPLSSICPEPLPNAKDGHLPLLLTQTLPGRLLSAGSSGFRPWFSLVLWELRVPSPRGKEKHWCVLTSYYVRVKTKQLLQTSKTFVNCLSSNWSGQCKQLLQWADKKHYLRAKYYFNDLLLGKNPKTPVKNQK